MITVDERGIITANRGDDFKLPLFINQGSETRPIRYVLKEKDIVMFHVASPNQEFCDALIKKTYNNQNLNEHQDVVVDIKTEDTLLLLPGRYYYEIKAKIYNEKTNAYELNTIIPKTQFYIEC